MAKFYSPQFNELIAELNYQLKKSSTPYDKDHLVEGLEMAMSFFGIPPRLTNFPQLSSSLFSLLKELPKTFQPPLKIVQLLQFIYAVGSEPYESTLLNIRLTLDSAKKAAVSKENYPLYYILYADTYNKDLLSSEELKTLKCQRKWLAVLLYFKAQSPETSWSRIHTILFKGDFSLLCEKLSEDPFHLFREGRITEFQTLVLQFIDQLESTQRLPSSLASLKKLLHISQIESVTRRNQRRETSSSIASTSQTYKRQKQKTLDAVTKIKASTIKIAPPISQEELEAGNSTFEEVSEEILQPEISVNDEPLSPEWSRKAAQRIRIKNAMDAQYLKNDWSRITPYEQTTILSKASQILHGEINLTSLGEEVLGAFATLMTFTLGAEPLFWANWRFEEEADENQPVVSKDLTWHSHRIVMEEFSWRPSSEAQLSALKPVGNVVRLPLEHHVKVFLKRFEPQNGQTIQEVIKVSAEQLDTIATKWLKSLFKDQNKWFTIQRVRDWLYQNAMSARMDETIASHLVAQPIHELTPGANYATLTNEQLQNAYMELFPNPLKFAPLEQSTPSYIGSKLAIQDDYLIQYHKKLKKRFFTAQETFLEEKTLTHLIAAHNHFLNHFLFMAFINTSHRDVDDPFPRHIDFLKSKQAVFITDKVIGIHNETRLSFYGSAFAEQLGLYESHLKNLSKWLARFDCKTESAKVYSALESIDTYYLPFCFYLSQQNGQLKFESVTRSSLNAYMSDFGFPWNFGRHLRATKFRELGLYAEYISYDFGHIGAGEQPYGYFSILNVQQVADQLIPKVNLINEQLEIEAISGLVFNDKKTKIPDIDSTETPRTLGFERRFENRKKRTKNDREIIKVAFKWLDGQLARRNTLDSQHFEQALEKVLDQRPSHLIAILNRFALLAKKYINQHQLKGIKLPAKIFSIKHERSTFNSRSAEWAFKGTIFRQNFNNKVLKTSPSGQKSQKAKAWLARLFISLQINGLISSPKLLEEIFHAIHLGDFLITKERFYLQLRYEDVIYRRIGLDHCSFFMLHQLLQLEQPLSAKAYQMREIQRQASEILDAICLEIGVNAMTIKDLKNMTQVMSALTLPGFICPLLSGERHFESLDEPSYIRFLTQSPLKPKALHSSDSDHPHGIIRIDTPIKQNLASKPNIKVAKRQLRELYAIIRDKTLKSHPKRVKQIVNHLNRISQEKDTLQITQLIYLWVIYLLKKGGKRKTQLSKSFIEVRISYISKALIEVFYASNLLELNSDEFLYYYDQIVQVSAINQNGRKDALQRFHSFLENQFKLPRVVWEDIDVLEGGAFGKIDANVLSEQEYLNIQMSLNSSVMTSNSIDKEISLLLTLYFRLGMRVSEAFKISFKEVVITNRYESYLILIQNHLGGLKNKNSTRLIYFENRLTEQEFDDFVQWFQTQKSSTKKLTASIWSVTPEVAIKKIDALLKSSTGDSTLSPRNLRHCLATHRVSHLVQAQHLSQPQQEIETWIQHNFNTNIPSRRTLYHLAKSMGHGGPSTTLSTYTNHYEDIIPELINLLHPFEVDKLNPIETLTSRKANHLRTLKHRYQLSTTEKLMNHIAQIELASYENLSERKRLYTQFQNRNITFQEKKLPSEWKKWLQKVQQLAEITKSGNDWQRQPENLALIPLYSQLLGLVYATGLNPFGIVISDFSAKNIPIEDFVSKLLIQLKEEPLLSPSDIKTLQKVILYDI